MNTTTWTEFKDKKKYPKLPGDLTVDVAIVGGGLCGITAAYFLAKEGKSVAVLEQNEIGSDATCQTTAFLTYSIDTAATDLVSMVGKDSAMAILESHEWAIQEIENIIKKENIDCEFKRCSNYYIATEEKHAENIKEDEKILLDFGFDVGFLPTHYVPLENFGILEIKNQAKFHPLKFLYCLAQAAENLGVKIFEDCKVDEVDGDDVISCIVGNHTVKARDVIVATYDPLGNPKETFMKKGMYNSYVFEAEIPKGTIPEGIYEDDHNPYHYFRVDELNKKSDRIIIGGEDHRSEIKMDEEKNFRALEDFLNKLTKGRYEIKKRWVGPILEPSDGIALIGEYKPHKYLAAAFSGNGMTYSLIAARIFCGQITGRSIPWEKLYDPKRTLKIKSLIKKGKDYTGELIGGAVKNFLK